MVNNAQLTEEARWTRGARLTLLAGILFILLNVIHIGYRFTIPSLGWAGTNPEDEDNASEFLLVENAVGAASLLEPMDGVQSISGIPSREIINMFPASYTRPESWEVGKVIPLEISRGDRSLHLDVQLVHWTPAAWLLTNFGGWGEIWNWLLTLMLFGFGAFTFFNRPGNLAARFLFVFGLANLSITLGDSIPDYIALYFDLPAVYAKAFFSNVIFAYLLAPSFLGFSLTFPRPKRLIERQPLWLVAPYLVGSITILLLFTAPEQAVIGFPITLVMLLCGVGALIHSGLTMKDAISRAQLRWAVGGVIIGIGLFLFNFASNLPPPFREISLGIASLGFPVIVWSLAMAILRYRLFDIDIIIRKTLQYTLLTGLLALVYFGSVVLLQGLVENLTGENSPIVIVISTLGIAALFNPLRTRIQEFIDRRFYRQKYDAERAVAQFSLVTRDEVDINRLSDALLSIIDETMQASQTSVWLKRTQGKKSITRIR